MALAWLTAAFGTWAFGKRAGLYAGLCMATCIGIFLFTRIPIPDVMLTFSTALAMWTFLRTLDEEDVDLDALDTTSVLEAVRDAVADADAVVLEDYNKGVLVPGVIRAAIDAARTATIATPP